MLKLPPPLVIDHAPVVAEPPIVDPVSVIPVGVADSQTVFGPPAFTVGKAFTVIITFDVVALQGPAPSGSFVVNVSVTFPLVILGVYVDVRDLISENVPLPALQVADVAAPLIVPAKLTLPPAHTVCGPPALTIALGFIVIVLVSLTAVHAPAGSLVVRVSVTVPEKFAAGVYETF